MWSKKGEGGGLSFFLLKVKKNQVFLHLLIVSPSHHPCHVFQLTAPSDPQQGFTIPPLPEPEGSTLRAHLKQVQIIAVIINTVIVVIAILVITVIIVVIDVTKLDVSALRADLK